MISNIKEVNATWYTYDEICDHCGKTIFKADTFRSSEKPTNEKSFCLDCLRHAIDNGFNPYKENWK